MLGNSLQNLILFYRTSKIALDLIKKRHEEILLRIQIATATTEAQKMPGL